MSSRYSTLLMATKEHYPRNNDMHADSVFINNRYKSFRHATSKSIRLSASLRDSLIVPKLHITPAQTAHLAKMTVKIKSIRLKNLLLRIIHDDIFTAQKLFDKGITDSDLCCKCGQRENIEHLIFECWYSAQIWTRLRQIYDHVENRSNPRITGLEFIFNDRINRVKLNLHLELIRLLQNKDRPRILPRTLIKSALENLIVTERIENDRNYFKKLKQAIAMIQ